MSAKEHRDEKAVEIINPTTTAAIKIEMAVHDLRFNGVGPSEQPHTALKTGLSGPTVLLVRKVRIDRIVRQAGEIEQEMCLRTQTPLRVLKRVISQPL